MRSTMIFLAHCSVTKHLSHHPTGGGLSFNRFTQAAEGCARFIDLLENRKQINHRPRQAIQLADNQHVCLSSSLRPRPPKSSSALAIPSGFALLNYLWIGDVSQLGER
jgi:hypothetical protein